MSPTLTSFDMPRTGACAPGFAGLSAAGLLTLLLISP
jgi:hypothetical protein